MRLRNRNIQDETCTLTNKRIKLRSEDRESDNPSTSEINICNYTVKNYETFAEQHVDSKKTDCELNNYVLGHIFSFLELNSVRNCRLVSKRWNEEASLQLSNRSWFKANWQKMFLQSDQDNYILSLSKLNQKQRRSNASNERYALLDCLNNMSNLALFSNFEFDFEWLTNKTFQRILENFGSTLKHIIIRDKREFKKDVPPARYRFDLDYATRMDIVTQLLTKWSLKLITFQMEVKRTTEELTPMQMEWVKPNNIRELTIEGELTEYQSEFWIQLIKSCSCLAILHLSCVPKTKPWLTNREEIIVCESFFEKLSKLPEVTRKLKEFSWNGVWEKTSCYGIEKYVRTSWTSCDILKPVSNMEFSKKLTKVGIGPSNHEINTREPSLTLLQNLKVCGTKTITFHGCYQNIFF